MMKNKYYSIILGTVSLIGTVQAATITWGSATDVSTDLGNSTQVSTTGTLVEAFNTGAGIGTTTVNGVDFVGGADLLTGGGVNGTGVWAGGILGDATYDTLLDSSEYGGGGDFFTISVGNGNLVEGLQYEIQLWFVETRSGADTRVMRFSDGDPGNFVDLNDQFSIGTFTADNTGSQDLGLDAQGFGNAHINAYQIRLVPEPSSLSLLGLAGIGLILRRCRR